MKIKLIILLFILTTIKLSADNPLIKGVGMSDPHIRVFNDTVYLYCGHDTHPDDKTWVMKEWRVFRSVDLINWEQVSTISTKDNYMPDNSTDCWAGDAAMRNGEYYFYFSDRKRGIGVMQADRPGAHYVDALGKSLVSPMHDPTILIDDDPDKTPYMVYGDKEGDYHVVRLNDDMISIAEKPKPLIIKGKEWEAAPIWMDKNYVFKHNDKYYLSWGRDYAVSDNIYGPYQCVGSVGNGHNLDEYAHGSFFWRNGQFYHCWCYYIRPGYKYRETIISYCHIDDDGNIVTDTKFLDKHYQTGVGQYDSKWDKIEAEWYTGRSEEVTKMGNAKDGFRMADIRNGSYLHFANVNFEGKGCIAATFSLSNISPKTKVEVRMGNVKGPIIAEIMVNKAEPQSNEFTFNTAIEDPNCKADLFLVFKGDKGELCQLDWFKFFQN